MNDAHELTDELAVTLGIFIDEDDAEALLDQYVIKHRDGNQIRKVAELDDTEDKVYVFTFPNDAHPESVKGIAQSLHDKFDNASILFASGDIDASFSIAEVDTDDLVEVEGNPKEN